MHVSALHIYPIKGCAGIEVGSLRLERLGPAFDRRFMLVEARGSASDHGAGTEGEFVTQRTLPRLCLISTALSGDALLVSAPSMPPLALPLQGGTTQARKVRVWRHSGSAEDLGDHAAQWFSTFVGQALRVVRFPETGERRVNPDYAPGDHHVAFADGYPILLTSEGSLEDLNSRLANPVPMNRFRPNLVVAGCAPFAEDGFRRIRVGEVVLDVVKPCDRCKVTTIDQGTAIASKEPLRTLATYRTQGDKVMFGQNCVYERIGGTIHVGDPVELLA